MSTLTEEILALLADEPGLTDQEIAARLRGSSGEHELVSQICCKLETAGRIWRYCGKDGVVGNYLTSRGKLREKGDGAPSGGRPSGEGPSGHGPSGHGPSGFGPSGHGPSGLGPSGHGPSGPGIIEVGSTGSLSEDAVKRAIAGWLEQQGWWVEVAWGQDVRPDLVATRGKERLIVEAKGAGSNHATRASHFKGVLGEILERMDDPDSLYAVAFPDLTAFREFWERLPQLARERTGLTALLVRADGSVRVEG